MRFKKLTFDRVMELLGDERYVTFDRVRARDLKRRVWVYGWGQPGCLYDAGPFCATTKRDAFCHRPGLSHQSNQALSSWHGQCMVLAKGKPPEQE